LSFKHVHDVLESSIPKHLKLTAVVLAEFADLDTGECWPSIQTIARRCSANVRTVQRNIRELESAGLVKRDRTHRSGTWIYRLTLDEAGGVAFCRGDTSVTEGVTPTPPEPSLNRQRLDIGAERFEEFWQAYPVKKGKKKAKGYWKRDKRDVIADDLIADVTTRITKDRQWVEGYIPWPQRYLNEELWGNDMTPPKGDSNGKTGKRDFDSIRDELRRKAGRTGSKSDGSVVVTY